MFSVSVSWLRNGIEPLDGSSSKYRISNAEGRPYTSTLTISSVKKEDAGTYTCQVLVNSIMKTDIKLFTLGLDVVCKLIKFQFFHQSTLLENKHQTPLL